MRGPHPTTPQGEGGETALLPLLVPMEKRAPRGPAPVPHATGWQRPGATKVSEVAENLVLPEVLAWAATIGSSQN